MDGDRGLAQLSHPDQWVRCVHDGTVLLSGGEVGLDWTEPAAPAYGPRWDGDRCVPGAPEPEPACPAGVTQDSTGRTWSTRPLDGVLLAEEGAGRGGPPGADGARYAGLHRPTGVAVDADGRLYVAEATRSTVVLVTPGSGRSPRRVGVPGRPLDLVAWGPRGVLVLLDGTDGDGGPAVCVLVTRPELRKCPTSVETAALHPPCGHPHHRPARITVLGDRPVVLWTGPPGRRCAGRAAVAGVRDDPILAELDGTELLALPAATDVEGNPDGLLAIGRAPGLPVRRVREEGDGRRRAFVEDEPLAAEGYDGGALTVGPDGRVVYTTTEGSRSTQGSVARHLRAGSVTTYRLDSGAYRTRWGRVFVDACLPSGAGLTVRAATSDDEDDDGVVRRIDPAPPARGSRPVADPDDTPPLPPVGAFDDGLPLPVVPHGMQGPRAASDPAGPGAGRTDPPGDGWATYETGVDAPPGRYLWLRLALTGTARTSPRVRAVRVERPGHPLLRMLPRSFSADGDQAAFLQGYLTGPEGVLHDLDVAAADRHRLVDPRTTPSDLLPWLAGFAGLVLDRRWPEPARRALVAEAYPLFARRGTTAALERMLRLYLGRDARVVERWRLRGLGGAVLGLAPQGGRLDAPSVDGNNVRYAGRLGLFTLGGVSPRSDSYSAVAHRFTVLVPGRLTNEQREVLREIVEHHKPAHTLADLCELGDGFPVGQARIGYTAYVGPPRTAPASTLGATRLDGTGTLGSSVPGARLARTATVGDVRLA
ncbi:phage tail protein I [Cellulomonas sp. NPDC055163]